LLCIRTQVGGIDFGVEAGECHFLNFIVLDQFDHGFPHCNFNSGFDGKPVNSATNGGEGKRIETVFAGDGKTGSIATLEEFTLCVIAAILHRANGVDDEPGGESIAVGDFCLAGFAASEEATFVKEIGAGRAMNCAIDATSA
jgi:hypothetical protein